MTEETSGRAKPSIKCNVCKIVKDKNLFLSDKTNKYLKSCIECCEQNKCTVEGCDRTFTNNSNLQRHIKNVHLKINYPCNFEGCNEKFSQNGNLKVHINTVHLKKKNINVLLKGVIIVLVKMHTYKHI